MPAAKVNTATLIRGETYSLRNPLSTAQNPIEPMRFTRNKPVVIKDKATLDALEEIFEELEDREGEVYEKPMFRVDRGVSPPEDEDTGPRRTRLSSSRPVKKRPRRR